MRLPKVQQQDLTARKGVGQVEQAVVSALGWLFREQSTLDFGIDGHIEVVADEGATGNIIACQIKAGQSFFSESDDDGITYRGRIEHLNYWSGHTLPVILILCDIEDGQCYWERVTRDRAVVVSDGSWKITVPRCQRIDLDSKQTLAQIAETNRSIKSRIDELLRTFGPSVEPRTPDQSNTLDLLRIASEHSPQVVANLSDPDIASDSNGQAGNRSPVDIQLARAKESIDAGQFLQGWQLLQQLGHPDAAWTDDQRFAYCTRIGCCHLAFGHETEAKVAFERAMAIRPDSPQAVTNYVISLDWAGESVEESFRLLAPILCQYPHHPEATHTVANLHLTKGEPEKAIEILQNQAQIRSDADPRRDSALANAYRLAGRYDEAETLARACILTQSREGEAYELLGDVLLTRAVSAPTARWLSNTVLSDLTIDRPRLAEAVEAFEKAAKCYEDGGRQAAAARCQSQCGVCYVELGNIASARRAFEAACSESALPRVRAAAFRGLGRLATSEGQLQLALEHFTSADDLEGGDPATVYNRALTLAALGRYFEVSELLEPLRDQEYEPVDFSIDIEVLRAEILWRSASEDEAGSIQRREAEALLDEINGKYSKPWQAQVERAQWRLAEGRVGEAIECINEALNLAPGHLLVLEIAVRVLHKQGDPTTYAAVAQRLIQRKREAGRPNLPFLYHNCAVALVQGGRYEEALDLLDSAASEPFPADELLDIRASVLTRVHRTREARDCFNRILVTDQDNLRGLIGLAQVEWELFYLDDAYRNLVRAYSLGDTRATACLNLMTLCRELGAGPEALRWASVAVSTCDDITPAEFFAAIHAAQQLGRPDLAVAWTALFAVRWPNSEWLITNSASSRQERDEQIAQYLAQQHEHHEDCWQRYRSGGMSLGRLAFEVGEPTAVVWEQIIRREDSEYDIRCHPGTVAEDVQLAGIAFETEEIVIDMVALLTLDLLGHLYLLPRLFRSIYIPDALFVQLRADLVRTPDLGVRYRLHRIIEFVSRNPRVVRLQPDGEQSPAQGPSDNPESSSIAFYTDEVLFQRHLRSEKQPVFGTCGLLKAALSKDLIDENEYWRSIRVLLAHSYTTIVLNSKSFVDVIRADPSFSNRAARQVLDRIGRPGSDRYRSAPLLGEILFHLYSDWPADSESLRDPWICAILDRAHADDPDDGWMHATVHRCVVRLCGRGPLPQDADGIRAIYDWAKSHGIDRKVIAQAVGQAAREVGRDPKRIRLLLHSLTSQCPRSFKQLVRTEAFPDLTI